MLSNKVSEIMTTGVVASPASSTVHDVVQLMAAKKIGAVVITEEQAAVGIFTEHDIVRRVLHKKRAPKTTGIKRVMTSPVRDVSGETHIIEALGKMYRGRFRHLLIRGEKGAMVGLVSMRDILKLAVELGQGLTDTQTVGAIMSKTLATVDAGDSVEQAVEKMVEKKTGCVVAVSGRRPVGIFTERDVLKWVATGNIEANQSRVQELMTAPLVSTGSSAALSDVLAEMHRRGFRNMPVVGDQGELAGIVSMGDVLKYARGLNVDESVRLAWKEVEEFWESDEHYTPG